MVQIPESVNNWCNIEIHIHSMLIILSLRLLSTVLLCNGFLKGMNLLSTC